MPKVYIEIEGELKQRFKLECARKQKTQTKVLTSLIIAWLKRR